MPKLDFASIQNALQNQFKGVDKNDPSSWPAIPRYLACLLLVVIVVVGLWFAWLTTYDEQLKSAVAKEETLKLDFKKKLIQAINLDGLKEQRKQVQQFVNQIERQLPSKSEMDALLSDINKARSDRALQLDLFKPGQVTVREYYAELPIELKVSGKYSQLGGFSADIAQLSRIVTLNNITITPAPSGILTMTAIAKTFRYLDLDEVSSQRKPSAGAAATSAKPAAGGKK